MKKREVNCKECGKVFSHFKKIYCCDFCREQAKKRRDRKKHEEEKKMEKNKVKINPMFLVRGKISNVRRGDLFQGGN